MSGLRVRSILSSYGKIRISAEKNSTAGHERTRNLRPPVCGGDGVVVTTVKTTTSEEAWKKTVTTTTVYTHASWNNARAGDDSAAYSRRPKPARAAGTGICPASAGDHRAPLDGDSVQFSHSYRSFVCRSPSARPFGRSSFSYVRDNIVWTRQISSVTPPPSNARLWSNRCRECRKIINFFFLSI